MSSSSPCNSLNEFHVVGGDYNPFSVSRQRIFAGISHLRFPSQYHRTQAEQQKRGGFGKRVNKAVCTGTAIVLSNNVVITDAHRPVADYGNVLEHRGNYNAKFRDCNVGVFI
jgi:hypothetical protein